MTSPDPGWTRAEWARWFLDHDEVDEAARVLAPGDELSLGASDQRDLAAALARRGLSAALQDRRLVVQPAASPALAAAPRRPPARAAAAPAIPAAKKKLG